ncbi:MAG: DUF5009 domain-containing protein [Bacteroidales bacterium]|jgi:predicted acyltransferase|nr:DUF5009 domain-containing protein [Bacteroidales bacterium]
MASERIASIDIMRGLTILLMLFVNDLNMDVVPAWLGHTVAGHDGMGLADWVFPGFLFIAGMSVPFAFSKRTAMGLTSADNSRHILTRSVSLLIIGILMLNTGRVNPELTGIGKNLWALLMYIAVLLIWNNYPDKEQKIYRNTGFRLAGIGLLILLVFRFRSGLPENDGSLIAGWWGILGQIGWGYMAAAFVYLIFRDSLLKTITATLFFLALNILSAAQLTGFMDPIRPFLGVVLDGSVPFLVLCGVTAGVMMKNAGKVGQWYLIRDFVIAAVVLLAAGFFLRRWFIISKLQATPSWGLICSGISLSVFIIVYLVTDIYNRTRWAAFFRPAGENPLTTYIFPSIIYHLIQISGIQLLYYKQSELSLVVIAGSMVWTVLMVWIVALLKRAGISLKL